MSGLPPDYIRIESSKKWAVYETLVEENLNQFTEYALPKVHEAGKGDSRPNKGTSKG